MAKKTKNLYSRMAQVTRDTNIIARPLQALRLPFPIVEVEDRRRFHPLGSHATPKKTSGRSSRFVDKIGLTFADARNVLVCARRKSRKQVLHALKKSGRSGQRKPRRSWVSNVRCK